MKAQAGVADSASNPAVVREYMRALVVTNRSATPCASFDELSCLSRILGRVFLQMHGCKKNLWTENISNLSIRFLHKIGNMREQMLRPRSICMPKSPVLASGTSTY